MDREEVFQQRVDELLLLEQRAARRGEAFVELTNVYHEQHQLTLAEVSREVSAIKSAADAMRDYVAYLKQQTQRLATVFLVTVVVCTLLVVGTVWWSHRVQDELAHDRETLLMLAVALNHLPEMVSFRGKPYVRVVADKKQPVIRLLRRDGTSLPGHYAQVWRATPQRH